MKKINVLVFVVLVMVLLSACGAAPTATQATAGAKSTPGPATAYVPPAAGQPTAPSAASAYPAGAKGAVQVFVGEGKAKVVDAAALKALAKAKVSVNGKEQELRKLADLLKTAGVTAYKNLTVVGRNGRTSLTSDQVGTAYLDIAEDGTIKLAVEGVAAENWITGVMQVNVQP